MMFKESDMSVQQYLPAGDFSSWLDRIRSALLKDSGIDVPCGDCYACCRSSYFIHIRPEETRTISSIPGELLSPAPGLPSGNVLLGYDENGRCPMLVDEKCSIYDTRPLTCRNYDCRVFAATGISPGEADKILIDHQVKRWKFSYPTIKDRKVQSAVKEAARFLRERAECFPEGVIPANTTQLAILAIKVYNVFLKYIDDSGVTKNLPPDETIVSAVLEALDKFGAESEN